MVELEDTKLFIWDLDETLWSGTLSEGDVSLDPKIIHFIDDTLDMGIVHSICSKNDFDTTKQKLQQFGVWDRFVFPSINWEPKGKRIKELIDDMKLRSVNVVFVDDNIQNLNEAEFYNNGIKTMLPTELVPLFELAKVSEKKDKKHKRLRQYRVLEQKRVAKSQYASNEDFLYSCNIQVKLHDDCESHITRLYELVMRTNQLNYTKFRQSEIEFKKIIDDKNIKTGYVTVKDKFGDYGIVGFYAINDNRAIHYLFSCRTLGMLVEQYVYIQLGCPELKAVGQVATKLDDKTTPAWINQINTSSVSEDKQNLEKKVLLKGPCDMSQIFSFITDDERIITEFTYEGDNNTLVEGHNATGQIITALIATEEEKKQIIGGYTWFDDKMLNTALRTEKFDFVVLSMLTDGNLGIYQNISNGYQIALCEKYYDLTDPNNFQKYIDRDVFTSQIRFTRDDLERFAKEYKFLDNSTGEITLRNLDVLYKALGNVQLVLLLGSEIEFKKQCAESYKGRDKFHHLINQKIELWATDKPNVTLLKFENFMDGDKDYLDTINHFTKRVYYRLAHSLVNIINSDTESIQVKGRSALLYETLRQKYLIIRKWLRREH